MKKINIILITILIILLGGVGFLGFTLFKEMNTVKVPDLNKATLAEVNEWCGSLKENSCKIDYEYSDTVEKDIVIYQSIKEGEKVDGTINFTVSLGKKPVIEIPSNLLNMKKSEIENWASTNGLTAVTYVVESSDNVIEGNVIRIEPHGEPFHQDTPVEVVISSGPSVPEKNVVDGKINITSGEFAGISVSSFETNVKKLNLVPYHNTDKDAYNSSIAKGNIVWHGSGEYVEKETISYGICLGKKDTSNSIDISKGTYVGKTVTDFETAVKNLGLVPTKTDEYEDYSENIGKGKVIWHGSGEYENGEKIRYSVSLGSKDGSEEDLTITKGKYVGKSVSDFEATVKALGLVPQKTSEFETTSTSVAKGYVVWHGSGEYEKGETIRYSLSLGKEGESSSIPDETTIKKEAYVGKTVSEFETIAKSFGLVPQKTTAYEDYSDTVAAGNIIWHGYGLYEKGETFRYSVSKGKKDSGSDSDSMYVSKNTYVGKTVSEFETAAKALGLVPSKTSDYEDYSDTVAKGNIIWHGYGPYEKGETFRYSVSLGKKNSDTTPVTPSTPTETKIPVSADTYVGKTVSEFESAVKALGLVPSKTTEHQDNSSSIPEGNIIWHGAGNYAKGETIRYAVSLGPKAEVTVYLASTSDLAARAYDPSNPTYENSKSNIETYLRNAGFTNYSVTGEKSNDSGTGVLIGVTVNGSKHVARTAYKPDSRIVVTISTGLN